VSAIVRQPFPHLDIMPPALNGIVLDFLWDHRRLWSLNLPVTQVPVADLGWHLDLPMWTFEGRPFVLTPKEVAQNPQAYPDQYARTLTADTSVPLHLLARPSRLTVLDGMHRLLKACMEGRRAVLAKKIPAGRLDEIATPSTRD
jgi:hypothetical protein